MLCTDLDSQTEGRMDGQTQTDMTKRIVAFRNFANAPKKTGFGASVFIAETGSG
jgi:hypothetical protein